MFFVLQCSQFKFVDTKVLLWRAGSPVIVACGGSEGAEPPCLTETPQPHDITDGGMVNIDFAVAVHSLPYDEPHFALAQPVTCDWIFSSSLPWWVSLTLWNMTAFLKRFTVLAVASLVDDIAELCNGWTSVMLQWRQSQSPSAKGPTTNTLKW